MIEIDNISKKFDNVEALTDVSAQIRESEVFGLIGTNGAGKSTLLRIMSGILRPDKGNIRIDQQDVYENIPAKTDLFYISDDQFFFPNDKPRDMMSFYKGCYPTYDEQRFEELQSKSKSALEELRKHQEEELQQLLLQYKQSSNEVKPSSNYLKLKKEEEGLVKLRKFKEAEIVIKKKEEQRKIDESKTGKNKEITYKNYEKKLKQKHMNELQYIQNKFKAEFDELAKKKQKDMEFLDKKYSVKNKDLINQQKREDTIHKFKNYGNRIANLSNNYEIKYSIEKYKNKEPIKPEKSDRIFAELNDENNKYIEDEILKENEKTPKKDENKEIKNKTGNEKNNNNLYDEEENEEREELKDNIIPEYEN